jgi:hypothetical protein
MVAVCKHKGSNCLVTRFLEYVITEIIVGTVECLSLNSDETRCCKRLICASS